MHRYPYIHLHLPINFLILNSSSPNPPSRTSNTTISPTNIHPLPPIPNPQQKKMLPSSPTTTTTSLSISLFSLFFLTILPTLTSALPTPLSPTTSDVEMITPALQFLPQRAVPLTQRMDSEMPMVIRREETSDEEGSDDAGPDCKFFFGNVDSDWEFC